MSDSFRNIIWITLDMVRADHTSMHGYDRDTTPCLNNISSERNSVTFRNCFATHPKTYGSVTSMMTGLFPSRHQIGMKGDRPGKIPSSMDTAPDLLRDIGYYTFAVSSGWAGGGTGLDERFDKFIEPNISTLRSSQHIWSLIKYLTKMRSHGPGIYSTKRNHGENTAFFRTDMAKRELDSIESQVEPFFAYIHYFDTHDPFYPPTELIDEFTDSPDEAYDIATQMHEEPYRLMEQGIPWSNKEFEMLNAMYDSVIKHVDRCVSNLYHYIQDNFDDTIIVITSDHGVLLGEYDLLGHRIALHDAVIHVPLIVSGLEELHGMSQSPVQHIDIMQTILSKVGADTSQFQGYNLFEDNRKYTFSQYRGVPERYDDGDIIGTHPDADVLFNPEVLITCMRDSNYKLLYSPDWARLFELPDETVDKGQKNMELFGNLQQKMESWLQTVGYPFQEPPVKGELSEDVEKNLRDMGYLS